VNFDSTLADGSTCQLASHRHCNGQLLVWKETLVVRQSLTAMQVLSSLCAALLAVAVTAEATAEEPGVCLQTLFKVKDEYACKVLPSSQPPRTAFEEENPASVLSGWKNTHHCVWEHCVYANPHIGGGVVLVTNRDNAELVAGYKILNVAAVDPPPFYEADVPGKGRGLIANRSIAKGEVIMVRTAAMMIQEFVHRDLDPEARSTLYEIALHYLPEQKQEEFMRQFGHDIHSKLDKNAFQMALTNDQDDSHLGCFVGVSRFNHDCRPKCVFHPCFSCSALTSLQRSVSN
jgi:hypothetical protein